MKSRLLGTVCVGVMLIWLAGVAQAAYVSVKVDTSVSSQILSQEIPLTEMRTEGDLRLSDSSAIGSATAWGHSGKENAVVCSLFRLGRDSKQITAIAISTTPSATSAFAAPPPQDVIVINIGISCGPFSDMRQIC
jgi:hypothetical protein